MIQVFVEHRKESILQITISGHANSTTEMMDLVCAQVSAVSVGLLNAIEILCPNSTSIDMESGYINIRVLEDSTTLQILLQTLEIQLRTVENTNYKYIKIKKREV